MADHRDLAVALRDHGASYRRRTRETIPATPEAVLDALGGSYTVGLLARYQGGGCTQTLVGANGHTVNLRDGRGRPATAEHVGPDHLMVALLASVERENARRAAR